MLSVGFVKKRRFKLMRLKHLSVKGLNLREEMQSTDRIIAIILLYTIKTGLLKITVNQE